MIGKRDRVERRRQRERKAHRVTDAVGVHLLKQVARLVQLAHVLAQNPGAALPAACGSSAMLKAAYRFFANDDIEPPDIVQSHIEATYSRLNPVPLVLAVQDTTEADWTSLRATEGLGPLGHTACQGLLVHTTLAITPDRVPLGLLAQQVWARDPNDVGKRARRKQLPISQKESQKWLWSLEAVFTAQEGCPNTRFVSVGDREADNGQSRADGHAPLWPNDARRRRARRRATPGTGHRLGA